MDIQENILKVVKKIAKEGESDLSSANLLPWVICLFALIIIIIYLIRIEINSNKTNWDLKKCSSKYLFFSGFMNNENKEPLRKTLDNFKDCVQRFTQNKKNIKLQKYKNTKINKRNNNN
jgi:glucan phosphoethanolaminetransferase (alkaline phosphatase superfamily)